MSARTARDVIAEKVSLHAECENCIFEDALCGICKREANAILSALRSAGFAVVPVEPTEGMLESDEMSRIVLDHARALHSSEIDFSRIYKAMLKAAQEDSRG